MIFMMNVHPSRAHDLITPDRLRITPSRAISPYIDGFGNKCVRTLAPHPWPAAKPCRPFCAEAPPNGATTLSRKDGHLSVNGAVLWPFRAPYVPRDPAPPAARPRWGCGGGGKRRRTN